MDLNTTQWAVAVVSALMIGMAKTGLPGVGILCVPLMAMILPSKASTGIVLPMLIFADVFAVGYYHRHAVWPHLVRLMPWALAGIILGYFIMGQISDAQLKPIIGIIVLAMLGVNCFRDYLNSDNPTIPTQWQFAAMLGLAAGVTTMLANAAGPIMIIYLLAMRLPKEEFIGTGAWFFFFVNWIKVPFSAALGLITVPSLLLDAVLAAGVVAGAAAGILAARRIPQKLFDLSMLILTAAAAVRMFF